MKTLLMIGGGVESVPGIQLARRAGICVVVSDGDPNAPGLAHADHRIVESTYDEVSTTQAAARFHREVRRLDGVLSVAVDVPLTVATVASTLGLPGLSLETAHLAVDKLVMKDRLADAGIPVPRYQGVESSAELKGVLTEWGADSVVKPRDSRGARGVIRLSGFADIDRAFNEARAESPTGRVMVEEFAAGPQVSTESIILGEDVETPGFSDRNYEFLDRFAPYIIENGGEMPSRLPASVREEVTAVAVAAARELGIDRGTSKADMVLTPEGPVVIEIAPRLSGGWFCTDQIPAATGVNVVGLAIRVALGERVESSEAVATKDVGVATRYWFVEPGTVRSIDGLEQFRSVGWVHRLEMFVEVGQVVQAVKNHADRAGCVICIGANREQAVERAKSVIKAVDIRMTE